MKHATGPVTQRLRLETIRRNVTVQRKQSLTRSMLRVVLTGPELKGFQSPSPDDHIKIFFPDGGQLSSGRDYTPRRFESSTNTLEVDFFLHERGVGSDWARQAAPGDAVVIGGPRGSTVIQALGAEWILIGDETAIPSVGRRLSEMEAGQSATSVLLVDGAEDEQPFQSTAATKTHWVHRGETQASDAELLLRFLRDLHAPTSPSFVWIAGESEVARSVRAFYLDVLKHPPEWLKASSYWSLQSESTD